MQTGQIMRTISHDGFAFVPAAEMRAALTEHGTLTDWASFAASWDDLGLDTYMADGGRYRKRRHAVFGMTSGASVAERKPHQPHYQSRDYNALNGGIERWFEPVQPAIGDGPTMHAVLATCRDLFERLTPDATAWHIEVHQFRITARPGESGHPTPEGQHRDGVDHVLVLLIGRQNVASGVTTIQSPGPDGRAIERGAFTLAEPLDAAIVDDARVTHGVTPVVPIEPDRPAFRDVLVVTFKREFG
jgi:hypothetical protein